MVMGMYQIFFIVAALTYSVRCEGYGPAIGHHASRSNRGAGGINIYGAIGEKTMPGMGSYTGAGESAVGGIGGRTGGSVPPGGAGKYGAGAGSYIGSSTGIGLSGRTGQAGAIGGAPSYNMPPKPYNVGYQSIDEQGALQYKEESGDESGTVRGKYGYSDSQGQYRKVEYVADRNGFKADIMTNEPGVGKDSPADVRMNVQQTPAGIQERYTPDSGASGSRSAKNTYGGTGMIGMPSRPASGGFQITAGAPSAGVSGVLGHPSSGVLSGTGALSWGSGLFSEIKTSSSAKSTY